MDTHKFIALLSYFGSAMRMAQRPRRVYSGLGVPSSALSTWYVDSANTKGRRGCDSIESAVRTVDVENRLFASCCIRHLHSHRMDHMCGASNEALSRIEEFTHTFVRRVQRCKIESPALVYMGVPYSGTGRSRRIPWEFPSSRQERIIKWGSCKLTAQLFRVLEYMHHALSSGVYVTKRWVGADSDIFYRDMALFVTQRAVDCTVERITRTLNVPRAQLGICATAKGLVAGPVMFSADGQNCRNHPTPQLIPDPAQGLCVRARADWILIVEKDAVFETLMSHLFLEHGARFGVPGTGCLVTGKGYPDIATRWTLKQIAKQCPNAPIYVLVDADPHGIDILRVYFDSLDPKRVVWLGVKTSDWLHGPDTKVMRLRDTDRRKAMYMIRYYRIPLAWQ